jgi:hypothetical protein
MTDSLLAKCPDCQKTYRVPRADRAYRCKACGGTLKVEGAVEAGVEAGVEAKVEPAAPPPAAQRKPTARPEQPSDAWADQRACPKCKALQVQNEPYCAECGAALDAKANARSHAERVERREASEDIARSAKLLRIFRALLLISCALHLIGVAVAAIALTVPGVDVGATLVGFSISAASAALAFAAWRLLPHQPVLWSLLYAGTTTLSALVSVLSALALDASGASLLGTSLGSGLVLLLSWWIVLAAVRVQRVRRAYPDLYAAAVLSGGVPVRGRAGESSAAAAARALEIQDHARRRAVRGAALAAGGLLAACAALGAVAYFGMRAAPLADYDARLRTAWNAADVDALVELCAHDHALLARRRLEKLPQACDWSAAWPELRPLGDPDITSGGKSARTRYVLGKNLDLEVHWRLTATDWKIERLGLPAPPIDSRSALFENAWRSGEFAQIAALYPEHLRSERERNTQRFLERLDWPATKAVIKRQGERALRRDRREVTFELAEGRTLDAHFELDDELTWQLISVRTTAR